MCASLRAPKAGMRVGIRAFLLPGVINGEQLLVSVNSIPERRGGMTSFTNEENLTNEKMILCLNHCRSVYAILLKFHVSLCFNSVLNSGVSTGHIMKDIMWESSLCRSCPPAVVLNSVSYVGSLVFFAVRISVY